MHVALIETAPADEPGSMQRVADLVVRAVSAVDPAGEFRFTRINLAACGRQLARLPARFRSWGHHAVVAARATMLAQRGFDLFHIVDGSHAYLAHWLPSERTVSWAHDLIPLLQARGRFPVPPPGRGAQWLIQRSLQGLARCSALLSISENTARDLTDAGIDPSRVFVCHLVLGDEWFAAGSVLRPTESAGRERYIFHVGNNGFYKNREGVVQTMAQLRDIADLNLKLAGPPPNESLLRMVEEHQLAGRVEFIVHPSDDQLRTLYRQAALFLFPSYYEGFGWPPLEAMACGCPVVSSRCGSLPEVVGDAGLTAEPDDYAGMAALCRAILENDDLAAVLRRRGLAHSKDFNVPGLGAKIVDVYRQVAGRCLQRDAGKRTATPAMQLR